MTAATTFFEVQGLDLIPQRYDNSCWYACARMILNWKDNRQQGVCTDNPEELDGLSQTMMRINSPIFNNQILSFARRLDFSYLPPTGVTLGQVGNMLRMYGPLWLCGDGHIVVIAGIDGDSLKVYDPSPVNIGNVDWWPFDVMFSPNLGSVVSSPARLNTSTTAVATFLYLAS